MRGGVCIQTKGHVRGRNLPSTYLGGETREGCEKRVGALVSTLPEIEFAWGRRGWARMWRGFDLSALGGKQQGGRRLKGKGRGCEEESDAETEAAIFWKGKRGSLPRRQSRRGSIAGLNRRKTTQSRRGSVGLCRREKG